MTAQVAIIKATLKYRTREEFVRGMTPLITKRGMFIHTRQTRPAGAQIKFEFALADGSQTYTGEGIVRKEVPFDADDPTRKSGMLVALQRVNHAFKDVVDEILSAKESSEKAEENEPDEKASAEPEHKLNIVEGHAGNGFFDDLGDLDMDEGLDSLFSSIEKTPSHTTTPSSTFFKLAVCDDVPSDESVAENDYLTMDTEAHEAAAESPFEPLADLDESTLTVPIPEEKPNQFSAEAQTDNVSAHSEQFNATTQPHFDEPAESAYNADEEALLNDDYQPAIANDLFADEPESEAAAEQETASGSYNAQSVTGECEAVESIAQAEREVFEHSGQISNDGQRWSGEEAITEAKATPASAISAAVEEQYAFETAQHDMEGQQNPFTQEDPFAERDSVAPEENVAQDLFADEPAAADDIVPEENVAQDLFADEPASESAFVPGETQVLPVDEIEAQTSPFVPGETQVLPVDEIEASEQPAEEPAAEQGTFMGQEMTETSFEKDVYATQQVPALNRVNQIDDELKSETEQADEEIDSIKSSITPEIPMNHPEMIQERSATLSGFPAAEETPSELLAEPKNEASEECSETQVVDAASFMKAFESGALDMNTLSEAAQSPSPAAAAENDSETQVIDTADFMKSFQNKGFEIQNKPFEIEKQPFNIDARLQGIKEEQHKSGEQARATQSALDELLGPVSKPAEPSHLELSSVDMDSPIAGFNQNAARRNAKEPTTLESVLKATDIKSKDVIMTDVNVRKATPRKRNANIEETQPTIPTQKKGGFFSNLFKK